MPSHIRAEGSNPLTLGNAKPEHQPVTVNWRVYAATYDLLSLHNPEYQALLRDFETFLTGISPPKVIFDIGGGTGNYTQIAARACPDSDIRLIEPDAGMIAAAKVKLAAYHNVSYQNLLIEEVKATDTADMIVCVHALYTMPDPKQRLADLRRMLKPGGWLYLVDLGRQMDVADWRRYLFASLRKDHGLLGALRILWQGREIAKQNKNILKEQKAGIYWTHTEAEIAAYVAEAGFEIVQQQTVYRGYSDRLVCRARPQ